MKSNIINIKGLFKNITLVASGTLIAQIIGILVSPLITRLYTPAHYGVMTVFLSTISMLSIAASFSLNKSIPIIENDSDSKNMVFLSYKALIIYTILVFFVCLFVTDGFFKIFGMESLYYYRFFLVIGVFLVGSYNILIQWIYRKKMFSIIPKTQIIQVIFGSLVKIIGGYLALGPIGLIAGIIISEAAGLTLLIPLLKLNKINKIKYSLSFSHDFRLLKENYRFPLFSMPSDLIDNISNQLLVFVLAGLFSISESGYYGLANTIISIPVSLIIVSISRVVFSEAASYGKQNPYNIKILCLKVAKIIGLLVIIPSIIVIVWGPHLFGLVYGSGYMNAGIYAKLILIRIIPYCIVVPIARVLEIIECQKYDLIINLLRFTLLIGGVILIRMYNFDSYTSIVLLNIVSSISYFILFLLILILLNKQIKKVNMKGNITNENIVIG